MLCLASQRLVELSLCVTCIVKLCAQPLLLPAWPRSFVHTAFLITVPVPRRLGHWKRVGRLPRLHKPAGKNERGAWVACCAHH